MVAGGIMNDKEKLRHQLIMAKSLVKSNNKKIKEVLGILEKKIKFYEYEQKEFFATKQYDEASYFGHMKELLEEIKEKLEE